LATPLTIVKRADEAAAIQEITDIIRKNGVGRVIAGLPLNMDGTRGIQADKTMAFVETLSRCIEIPVEYRDERLSTVAARELVQGVRKTGRQTRYDAAAAALILQGYLDDLSGRRPEESPPPAT
jgi:putative Holliday junction resolvase